jgi:uncharacterized membrane protein YgcG
MALRDHIGDRTAALVLALGALVAGCQPKIGDHCTTSIDCSQRGDRLCDTSQPDGYCTIFNCEPDKCPDNSVCVGFSDKIDATCGDLFDPRWPRFERTFCMKACESTADCRDGYVCAPPRDRRATSIDLTTDWKDFNVCFPALELPPESVQPAPACYATGASSSSSSASSASSSSTSSSSSASSGAGGGSSSSSSSSSSSTGSAGGAGG